MRSHLEHPYPPNHQIKLQPPYNPPPTQNIVFTRPYHSPSSYYPNPPDRPSRKQSFTHESPSSLPFSAYNPNAPVFRELRQRYINQPSTPIIQERESQTFFVKKPEIHFERVSMQKKQKLKQENPKTTLSSVPSASIKEEVKVPKKSVQSKNQKKKSDALKMEAIMEQLPYLQESKALFSQINYFKRRMTQLQDQNNQLKAQLFTQQVKNSTDLANHQQQEQKLIQQVKSLKIQLQKNSNEVMMAKISEAETLKQCQKIMAKYRQQQKEIIRLKEQVGEKYSERDSTTKSQTGYSILP